MKIQTILAGVDLGPETEQVLAYAAHFAKRFSASLNLLSVIDFVVTPPTYLSPYLEEEKKILTETMEPWEKALRAFGVSARSEVVVGRLHESYDAAMRKDHADLLVLGFRSHAVRRSSSEKLIKDLSAPMLVVRGEKALSAKIGSVRLSRILCPTDLSESSVKALKLAQDLKALFSAELQVVHILDTHGGDSGARDVQEREEARQEMVSQAGEMLDAFLKDCSIDTTGLIAEGDPFTKVCSFSKEHDVDLIVMGARGLSLVKELVFGSVTDAVLKSSPCPVLVVH